MIVKTLTPNYLSLKTRTKYLLRAIAKVSTLFGNRGFGIVSCAPLGFLNPRVSGPGHQGGATCHSTLARAGGGECNPPEFF